MQYEIDIPSLFAEDHSIYRDIWGGELIKQGKNLWRFRCNEEELAEWLSDAEFYSDTEHWKMGMGSEEYTELVPIIRSAQRTVRRLKKKTPD